MGAAAAVSLTSSPESAADVGEHRGAVVEEFVCFRSNGDQIGLGTGKVITTPAGQTHVVCTGQPP